MTPDARWLASETDRLLDFGTAARHPAGGFGWLGEDGVPDLARPVELWITCRMTHVYALGHLLGRPADGALADHGVAALRGRFHDHVNGGWYAAVDDAGPAGPRGRSKTAYEHAFVVLAASSATAAGRPGAADLLADAVAVLLDRFWDAGAAMVLEEWDESFSVLDDYRGANANMHAVEALLAAADVLDDDGLRERALRIVTRIVHEIAAAHSWRIPEHFTPSWTPLLDDNADEPAHPFRPFGATIGHSFEWARLAVQLRAALGDDAPGWLLDDARALFDTAVREGWAVDGARGFVYTVDWSGVPVVRERMHWVAAEGIAAAAALHVATGDPTYAAHYDEWWRHVTTSFADTRLGSWHHELSPANAPSAVTWVGKPDLYHAVQATLLPRLPLTPSLATALARGLLT